MIKNTVTDQSYHTLISSCNADLSTGPWVAGGSVRKVWFGVDWKKQDVDFFFANNQQFENFCSTVKNVYKIHLNHPLYTSNAVTFTVSVDSQPIKLQGIKKRFYSNYNEIVDNIDINLSQFITDGTTMLATEAALRDYADNRIRPNTVLSKTVNSRRILKYSAYGFDPEPQLLLGIFKNVSSIQSFDDAEY